MAPGHPTENLQGSAGGAPAGGERSVRDPAWKRAVACGDFTLFKGEGKRVHDTRFRAPCDHTWLCVGVNCVARRLNVLPPVVRGHEKGACDDESVELFPGLGAQPWSHKQTSCLSLLEGRWTAICQGWTAVYFP